MLNPDAIPCRGCGAAVAVDPAVADYAVRYGVLCDACAGNGNGAPRMPQPRAVPQFRDLCPPCFADTAAWKLPCQDKSERALLWKYGPKGLNLWGYPGTGKTRTASLVVKALVESGKRVVAYGPGTFRQECESRQWKRGEWLKRLGKVDVLFIDDFDKMSLTLQQEKDLFSVLNDRMGRLPTIITGNAKGAELQCGFKLGEALVDRIRRYCECIHFGSADKKGGQIRLPYAEE